MRRIHWTLPAVLAATLLAACGGNNGASAPGSAAGFTSVKVMGDSLADSGTFASVPGMSRTFTVQGSSNEPNVLWNERITANIGAPALCAFFNTKDQLNFTTTTGCGNYAVGGGRINNVAAGYGGEQSPYSIVYQMAQAAKDNGSYKPTDLVLVDGGGNDAADLVGAYLKAASDGGKAFAAMVGTLVQPATLQPMLAQGAAGMAQAGGAYMTALADKMTDNVKNQVIAKGATHVAVLNMPGINLTPRLQMVIGSIAKAQGATAAAQAAAMFDGWVQTFNARLAANASGNKNMVVVDFYSGFKDQAANPAQYGLTNVTTPACPITGMGGDGLPTYSFATCTATALSGTTPPAGATGGADWWKTYAFSDGFHPTPYGHQLLGQLVSKSLAQAGWL